MNSIINKLAITTVSLSAMMMGFSAHAELGKKSSLSVNFNQMIHQSAEERSHLQDKMANHYSHNDEIILEEDDTQKVVDFVDVEVQFGKQRQMVDRRFNSVDEPRKEEVNRAPNSLGAPVVSEVPQMQVTLVSK